MTEVIYTCKLCKLYETASKQSLISHLQKKKICSISTEFTREFLINELVAREYNTVTYDCIYCQRKFNHRSNKSKHTKICKQRIAVNATQQGQPVPVLGDEDEDEEVPQVPVVYTDLPVTVSIDIQSLKEQLRKELMTENNKQMLEILGRLSNLEKNNQMKEIFTRLSNLEKNQMATTSTTAPTKAVQQKHKIPYSIRCKAWITHIGAEVGQTKCLCCKDNTITQFKFTCGHIVSRADGGTLAMENLRPICNDCNNDMGNENMREFALRIYNVEIV